MTMWKGREIIETALPHVGEEYVFGYQVPLHNPNWTGPWDCAEFCTWCAYQAYGVVFGAYGTGLRSADPYSGKWYEDAEDHGTLITADEALDTPGAIIGRRPQAGHYGHVAISLGSGRTVEARGTSYGVVTTENAQNRSWNFGALIPGVEYDSSAGTASVQPANDRILRVQTPYMRGEDVLSVQHKLKRLGVDPGAIDGIYGENTEAAVIAFQLHEGLNPDGEVGPDTAGRLGLGWPIGATSDTSGATSSTGAGGSEGGSYCVVAGDTLHKIAGKLGITLEELVAANPQITDINHIEVGDVIHVPESGAPGGATGGGNIEHDPRTVEILAKTIYGEARGEPVEGQHAVGFVVLNRVAANSWYGNSVVDVCLKPWQFSTWNANDPNRRLLDALSANDDRLAPLVQVARDVLSSSAPNPIDGATHYHASYVHPSWIQGATRVASVGGHIFYRDVD